MTYRPPRRPELADCALIWYSAVDDYMARLNRPLPSPYLDPLLKLLDHLLTTDPDRFLVAVRPTAAGPNQDREEVVGFGIAAQREHVWYLSQLYVLPEAQGHGIGRALLTQILPSAAAPDPASDSDKSSGRVPAGRPGILAMCTDSAQPVSNALYAGYGIVPRMPVFNLVGTPNPAALGRLPSGIEAAPLDRPEMAEAVDAIDRAVLGYAHPVDHAHLRAGGRTGFVFQTHAGEALGYGYSSEAGRFGPIAALDDTLTAPIIGHLMHNIRPRGATSAWVPGANDRATVALLRAGLRIEGFPALMCWTRPFGNFESYLPASLALL